MIQNDPVYQPIKRGVICLTSRPLAELQWNVWTLWTECSRTCGSGQQVRVKLCSYGAHTLCTRRLYTDRGLEIGTYSGRTAGVRRAYGRCTAGVRQVYNGRTGQAYGRRTAVLRGKGCAGVRQTYGGRTADVRRAYGEGVRQLYDRRSGEAYGRNRRTRHPRHGCTAQDYGF